MFLAVPTSRADGWINGSADDQPRWRTATSDGGVTSAAGPRGRGARARVAAGRPREELVARGRATGRRRGGRTRRRAAPRSAPRGGGAPASRLDALAVEPRVDHVGPGLAGGARATARGSGRSPRAGTPRTAGGRRRRRSPRRGRTAPCTSPVAAAAFAAVRGTRAGRRSSAAPAYRRRIRPSRVVQAAAVPVDEAPRRVRDELAERRDAVLQRHLDDGNRTARPGVRRLRRRSRNPTATSCCIA